MNKIILHVLTKKTDMNNKVLKESTTCYFFLLKWHFMKSDVSSKMIIIKYSYNRIVTS